MAPRGPIRGDGLTGSARYPTGLIVGRFCPPHLGHSHLIERAAADTARLVVFVNTRRDEVVPGPLRAGWLAELHPEVTVVEVDHDLPTDFSDPTLWDRWMTLLRSRWPHDDGPHAVFSSDGYVRELAGRFGAASIVIDPERAAVPISATAVRERPADHLDYLAPPVRDWVIQTWLR